MQKSKKLLVELTKWTARSYSRGAKKPFFSFVTNHTTNEKNGFANCIAEYYVKDCLLRNQTTIGISNSDKTDPIKDSIE